MVALTKVAMHQSNGNRTVTTAGMNHGYSTSLVRRRDYA